MFADEAKQRRVLDEGKGARQILGLDPGAIRTVIVGVVDEVALSE